MAIGLYLSGCRGTVSNVLDLEALAQECDDRASIVRITEDFFDHDFHARIIRDIEDAELDAVILAGHSVNHYEKSLSGRLLRDALVAAGINPSRLVFISIQEQVAAPHAKDAAGAQAKASVLLSVALMRAAMVDELPSIAMTPRQSVLIFGATVEGVVAAQRLLQLGYRVVIADRGDGLQHLRESDQLNATLAFVEGHPEAEILSDAHVVDGMGWVGDYEVTLAASGDVTTHHAGGMLLAAPNEVAWVEELRRHFKLDVDDEGRARSINPTTHPSETIEPGLMVVPAHVGERELRDMVAAADSAAVALALRLSQPQTIHYVQTSIVDETLCGACASCVKTCAFGACYIDEDGVSHVDPRRCRACGKCVVSCPVGARDIISSPHKFMIDAIHKLVETDVPSPKVLGIVCGGCGNPAMNAAAAVSGSKAGYPASFLPLWIPCSGRLDALYVLEAFRAGFDGVSIFRCREGHCHNLIGNLDMDRRIGLLRTVLKSRGIDDTRLRVVDISPDEGERFTLEVNDFFDVVRSTTNGVKEVTA